MTQDEIIEVAKKAGFQNDMETDQFMSCNQIELTKFAELILASQAQPTPSQSDDDEHAATIQWNGREMDTYYRGNKTYPSGTKLYTKPQPTSQDAERFYDLGFKASGEGHNGEHGANITGEYYLTKRKEAIEAAMKEGK